MKRPLPHLRPLRRWTPATSQIVFDDAGDLSPNTTYLGFKRDVL